MTDRLYSIDEYDSIFFQPKVSLKDLSLYSYSKHLVAFTGSRLEKVHLSIVRQQFNALCVDYPSVENIDGSENKCLSSTIFTTRGEQLNRIVLICREQ